MTSENFIRGFHVAMMKNYLSLFCGCFLFFIFLILNFTVATFERDHELGDLEQFFMQMSYDYCEEILLNSS